MNWWRTTRDLAWPLARKDLQARFRGSVLGVAWILIAPLLMVAVYALVFTGVFKARWPGLGDSTGLPLDYAVRLSVGLLMFSAWSEVFSRATRLIQEHASLVKRVIFPLPLLGTSVILAALGILVLQWVSMAGVWVLLGGRPSVNVWAAPLAVAWWGLLALGGVWALSACACYLRDLQQMVPVALGGLLFVSPVFYPLDAAPPALQGLLVLNPMAGPIELARWAWFGQAVDWGFLAGSLLGTLLILTLGRWVFVRLQPGFADLV
ncbi:ABC transporter permease [Inhella gelatinilytica]|uniref:Transport permease protein n=1 Tax=Inhella gelatinilytica TaxID=2795030 RepID=A0A931IZA1_9BURK|nr:ABC transporter permease [Inhella gelatinilytica]MBH9553318.1 ABC transporter permease [Inhella gelatinilytica]